MNQLNKNFDIVKTLALNELKIRYKRNILGFFWSLLNPILNICLISLVFSKIMNMEYSDFVIFLMPGITAWNLFINIINNSANSIIQNERLIKNIAINKMIFPLSGAGIAFIDFLLSFTSLIVLCIIFFYSKIHLAILFLPISIFMLGIFSLSIGTIISVLNVYVRDVGYIVNILLQILFFMTPVLYDKTRLGSLENIAKINPMLHFIDLFRDPIYLGHIPKMETILITSLWSFTSLIFAYIIMNRLKNYLVFRL